MALHPNAVRSASKDLEALGARPDDVLEIKDGPNKGTYVIQEVSGHVAFLRQVLPSNDAGPVNAVIRRRRDRIAYPTVAVVIDQPMYDAGMSQFALMDMLISS